MHLAESLVSFTCLLISRLFYIHYPLPGELPSGGILVQAACIVLRTALGVDR